MTEAQLQVFVAKTLDALGWLYCHVPNGGKRDVRTGATLKAQGVKRGVPDILVFERWTRDEFAHGWPTRQGFGVAIELKVGSNDTTSDQDMWLKRLGDRGWINSVCRTQEEVLKVLRHVRPMNGGRLA